MSGDYGNLFSSGVKIISNRQNWELRQRRYYSMRKEGLRRRNRPFPTAADLHLRLIDQKVTQKAAFTMATILGQPTLASFKCLKPQVADLTQAAQDFHHFELINRSNFIRVLQSCVDTMWLRGRGIIKSYVDPFDDYRLVFENVDPLWLLMPDDVNGFEDAYEWIHIKNINVSNFKRDRRYCGDYRSGGELDNGITKKLCGGLDAIDRLKAQPGQPLLEEVELDKEYMQGYLHSANNDTIVLWEHYKRTMGGITVYTYSPIAMDIEIRKPYGIPYKVNGRVSSPFFSLQAEVVEDGWYAARGAAEKIADMEIYGSKVWNTKADMLTFLTTPMFTSEVGVQNAANYRIIPGEVMPQGVKPAIFGTPPVNLDAEINFVRGEAELDAGSPDMAIEKPNQRGAEKRTAKEVQTASSISQIQMTNESTTIKYDLGLLFKHTWGLCLQFKRKELTYYASDDLNTVPETALHGAYLITAGGATDDWDKAQRLAKAQARYQLLLGKPNVDQDELLEELLAADDARLVKTLLVPTKQRAQREALDENEIINDICPGPDRPSFPVPVEEGQDHFTRAQVDLAWLDAAGKMNTPTSPAEKQRLFQRLARHMQYLKKLNPQQYQQLEMMVKKLEQTPIRRLPIVPPLPKGAVPRRPMNRARNMNRQPNNLSMI